MMDEFLDCITIDFKGSAEPEFTRKFIGVPDPQPIFDTIIEIKDKTKIHTEITDLIVPQLGATEGKLLKYATSGDVSGDKSSVVGYASIIFT